MKCYIFLLTMNIIRLGICTCAFILYSIISNPSAKFNFTIQMLHLVFDIFYYWNFIQNWRVLVENTLSGTYSVFYKDSSIMIHTIINDVKMKSPIHFIKRSFLKYDTICGKYLKVWLIAYSEQWRWGLHTWVLKCVLKEKL